MAPLIIAHRGASRYAPENTLPAFLLAWEMGADGIEGDFQLTKDGRIVCIHDDRTKRVAGADLVVNASTLAALLELDVGARFGKAYQGTRVPTLEQVLATVPQSKKIYVEIKCGPEIIPPLCATLSRSGLQNDQCVVISFNADVLEAFKKASPGIKTLWLAVMETDSSGGPVPSPAAALETLKRIKADGLSTSQNLNDRAYIKTVTAQGYDYHVWTVDDPQTAQRFAKWGAASITTNRPDYIKKHLAS